VDGFRPDCGRLCSQASDGRGQPAAVRAEAIHRSLGSEASDRVRPGAGQRVGQAAQADPPVRTRGTTATATATGY